MVDREKVIKGLMHCTAWSGLHECQPKVGDDCPYEDEADCQLSLMRDALVLLKEHEPRVMSAEELRAMPMGHGWAEYAMEPGDAGKVPWEDFLQEVVWVRGFALMVDPNDTYSHGKWEIGDDYGRAGGWRVWTDRPTEERSKAVKWE